MPHDLTTTRSEPPSPLATDEVPAPLGLAIGWSVHEPLRIGEVAFLDGPGPLVVGRQGTVVWMRHRPRERTPTGDLGDPALSREQLVFRPGTADRFAVACVGRAPMRVNGATVEGCEVGPGDVIEVGDRLVLVVHRRPTELSGERPSHPFGEADAHGFVGEGVAAWALREDIRFYAGRPAHVLVAGESGTGKELVARALHTLSGAEPGAVGGPECGDDPGVARGCGAVREPRELPEPGDGRASRIGGRGGRGDVVPRRVRRAAARAAVPAVAGFGQRGVHPARGCKGPSVRFAAGRGDEPSAGCAEARRSSPGCRCG